MHHEIDDNILHANLTDILEFARDHSSLKLDGVDRMFAEKTFLEAVSGLASDAFWFMRLTRSGRVVAVTVTLCETSEDYIDVKQLWTETPRMLSDPFLVWEPNYS